MIGNDFFPPDDELDLIEIDDAFKVLLGQWFDRFEYVDSEAFGATLIYHAVAYNLQCYSGESVFDFEKEDDVRILVDSTIEKLKTARNMGGYD